MAIRFKNSQVSIVNFNDFHINLFRVLSKLSNDLGLDIVITSLNDSKHKEKSYHYKDLAADIRTKNLSEEMKDKLYKALIQELGQDYTVIFEDRGGENEHIHIQLKNSRNKK